MAYDEIAIGTKIESVEAISLADQPDGAPVQPFGQGLATAAGD